MTTVHATISRNDYNALYTRLEQVMGLADGTVLYGWGQTMNAAGVAEGQKVSVEEYGRLITDMYNAYRHIYGSNPPTNWGSWPNNISASQKIKANTLTNDGTYNTQPYRRWNDLIIALEAAKYTIPPAATASLAIGGYIAEEAEKHFNNYEERINESYSVEKIIKRLY